MSRRGHVPGPRNKPDHTPRKPSGFIEEPLLVRLLVDVGKLPAGFTYALPAYEAQRLIARRMATAVGSLGQTADLELTEDELEEATA